MSEPSTGSEGRIPPIAYAVAVWLGWPADEIERGLDGGWIEPPPGAVADWQPSMPSNPWLAADTDAVAAPADGSGAVASGADAPSWTSARAAFDALLQSIDPDVPSDVLDATWQASGADDPSRGLAWLHALQHAAGHVPSPSSIASDPEAVIAATSLVADDLVGRHARFVALSTMTGEAMAAAALDDRAYRAAILSLEPFALAGEDLAAARAADRTLDRYDPETGDAVRSDAWLTDRARMLAWTLRDDDARTTDGPASWRFIDRTGGDSRAIEIRATGDAPVNQVVFLKDGGDASTGGEGVDRLHGGNGSDVLRGAGGDDLVEGGDGDDLLFGGTGRDRLLGGKGDDDLDGGRGDDVLQSGSGDDTLSGGRGDDWLEGGAGEDIYRTDVGDGHDTIVDVDGRGRLVIDDVVLEGEMRRDGDDWLSPDGRVRIALGAGGADHAAALEVHVRGALPHGPDEATVTLQGWRQGAMGIRLAPAAAEDAAAASTAPVPVVSSGNEAASTDADMGSRTTTESGTEAPWYGADPAASGLAPIEAPSFAVDRTEQAGFDAAVLAASTAPSADAIESAIVAFDAPDVPDVDSAELQDATDMAAFDVDIAGSDADAALVPIDTGSLRVSPWKGSPHDLWSELVPPDVPTHDRGPLATLR